MRSFGELEGQEKKEIIEKARKLREEERLSYRKCVKRIREEEKVEVSHSTLNLRLNPQARERKRKRRKRLFQKIEENADEILEYLKGNFDDEDSELVKDLNEKFGIIPSYSKEIVRGVRKLASGETDHDLSRWVSHCIHSLGGINTVKRFFEVPLLYERYGDQERVLEALKEGPKSSTELESLIKGKSSPGQIVSVLRKKGDEIITVKIPFSRYSVYCFKENRVKAYKKARDLVKIPDRIKSSHLKMDQEGLKFLSWLIKQDYVSGDDVEEFKNNYKGVFNRMIRQGTLKEIKVHGKVFYSPWPEKLEYFKTGYEILEGLSESLFS